MDELTACEFLNELRKSDAEYKKLCDVRADYSTALKKAAVAAGVDDLFEQYSDSIFAQEVYELEIVYRQGFTEGVAAKNSERLQISVNYNPQNP
jgi:hypothetical protein